MKMLCMPLAARNKQVSISGFWMDATEINNEYRQFTNWVKDSIARHLMGLRKAKALTATQPLTGKNQNY